MMLPPMGFTPPPAKGPASGVDTTWLVTTTAMPNSSAILSSCLRNLAKWFCRLASSPRPVKSVLYRAVQESTMSSENLDSAIMPQAWLRSASWWSAVYALA